MKILPGSGASAPFDGGRTLRRLWLILGWGMVATVVVLSLIPLSVDMGDDRDKLAHFVAYGSLSFWFGMLYNGAGRQLRIAIAFAAMGVVIECLQGMTAYRTFEFADMIANAIGAALGWGLVQTPLSRGLEWAERLIAGRRRSHAGPDGPISVIGAPPASPEKRGQSGRP